MLNLLIKPVSGNCNLQCRYCFYNDVSENRQTKSFGMMSRETAETLISKALREAKNITFGFQGGEPALWGLDNFMFFTQTVERLNTNRANVTYTMQTNGMLINDEWAAFFKEHSFLVGLSLDGYKELHEYNRPNSYNSAIKAAAILKKHGVEYNILSVVTEISARHAEKLYRFYQKQGFNYLQFIPCIDDFGSSETKLTADAYLSFLKALFDNWYKDCIAGRGISIRYFDNILSMIMGYPPEQCSLSGACNIIFTIEADGGVYPCDFYVLDKWKLGNVNADSFEAMLVSDTARAFIDESKRINGECSSCRCYNLCRGGCKRDREPVIEENACTNRFCEAYKEFFEWSYNKFIDLISKCRERSPLRSGYTDSHARNAGDCVPYKK